MEETSDPDTSKLIWTDQSKCWTCCLCNKKLYSREACNKHDRKKDCQKEEPMNPSWQLGWDRRTMSCRYCREAFNKRRKICKHLQDKKCPKLPDWDLLFGWQKANTAEGTAASSNVPEQEDDSAQESDSSTEEDERSKLPPGEDPQVTLPGTHSQGKPQTGSSQLLKGTVSGRISKNRPSQLKMSQMRRLPAYVAASQKGLLPDPPMFGMNLPASQRGLLGCPPTFSMNLSSCQKGLLPWPSSCGMNLSSNQKGLLPWPSTVSTNLSATSTSQPGLLPSPSAMFGATRPSQAGRGVGETTGLYPGMWRQ